MSKASGFDQLSKQLKEARKALDEIDGKIGCVSFDPDDPASLEAAINQINTLIDQKVGRYADNPIVTPLIEGMKDQYRAGILEKAAAARLEGSS